MRKAVSREPVDDAESVTEVVVEARPDYAHRQRVGDIADALAHVIPDVRDLLGRGAALEIDENGGPAGNGVAAQDIQLWCLLQLALEPLRNLLECRLDTGARPSSLNDHVLDDECGVLAAAEPEVGCQTCCHRDDHEEGDDGAMVERPLGEIESSHGSSPSRRTTWPGCRACTPAVTTISPASIP